MGKYAIISVPVEVKEYLEKAKGNKTWGCFLAEICDEMQRLKSKKAFEKLTQLLSKEDLKAIRESSKEFREKFTLQ